ncbi:MAG: hypothetical protein KF729_15170 [Sandaracinaceae bacterium]|nr:hypothetical protein [Sandaracinaceae bacterium]
MRAGQLSIVCFLLGCGSGPLVIDARTDGGVRADAAEIDGGAPDAGHLDGGAPDGGCAVPTLPSFTPIDTGGPAGEPIATCVARVGPQTDARSPVGQRYGLTTFGGASDPRAVSCAGRPAADGSWFYASGAQRFRCGQRVRLVDEARRACVVVEAADDGPHACVEEAVDLPVWDVSPLAAQALFGTSSATPSDGRVVFGAPVGSTNPLGACDLGERRDRLRGFVGGPCDAPGDCAFADAVCLTDFPDGACSLACETSCPDREGPHAFTACVDLGATGRRCLPRCDFTLFETGCRDGYACQVRPHPTGAGPERWVCLPAEC